MLPYLWFCVIIYNVRKNGDKALFEYCKKFDKAELSSLEVTEEEINEAISVLEYADATGQIMSALNLSSDIEGFNWYDAVKFYEEVWTIWSCTL